MAYCEKLADLRRELARVPADAVYLPFRGPHGEPDPAARFRDAEWLTGFSGRCDLVVTAHAAAAWVNRAQAAEAAACFTEAKVSLYYTDDPAAPTPLTWLAAQLTGGACVLVNGARISAAEAAKFRSRLTSAGMTLETSVDLVDRIRSGVPAMPFTPAWEMLPEDTGRTAAQKAAALRMAVSAAGATHCVLSSPEDIAWLFNLRGSDMTLSPLNYAYAMLAPAGIFLYIQIPRLTAGAAVMLDAQGITVADYGRFGEALDALPPDAVAAFDPAQLPFALRRRIRCSVLEIEDPVRAMRAVHTDAELAGTRAAALRGSAALFRAKLRLKARLSSEDTLTLGAAQELFLSEFRRGEKWLGTAERPEFTLLTDGKTVSLDRTTVNTALPRRGLLTLRLAFHYMDGTCTLCDTLPLGTPSEGEVSACTLTLRALLAGLGVPFPRGSRAAAADALVRRPFWEKGADPEHTVGCGVGHVTRAAEWPDLSDNAETVLKEGVFLSLAPTCPRDCGPAVCFSAQTALTARGSMLCAEPLTCVLPDPALVDAESLLPAEQALLQSLAEDAARRLEPLLREEEKEALASYLPERRRGRHAR